MKRLKPKIKNIEKTGLGIADPYEPDWKKDWEGMPEYSHEDKDPYKTIYVHFKNKEVMEEFSKLISQNITEKTISIWHPKEIETMVDKLWIDKEDE